MSEPQAGGSDEDAAEDRPDRIVGRRLLEVLVCPASGVRLEYDAERQELVSRAAGLAFPIRAGVPIMLIDDARPLDR